MLLSVRICHQYYYFSETIRFALIVNLFGKTYNIVKRLVFIFFYFSSYLQLLSETMKDIGSDDWIETWSQKPSAPSKPEVRGVVTKFDRDNIEDAMTTVPQYLKDKFPAPFVKWTESMMATAYQMILNYWTPKPERVLMSAIVTLGKSVFFFFVTFY